MQLSGLRFGSRLLSLVDFPFAESLGASATDEELQAFLERHGRVVVKPVFYGGVGKKGKAGLVRVVDDLQGFSRRRRSCTSPRTATAPAP